MRTTWVEICVSDLTASVDWFSRVLGFSPVERDAHYAGLAGRDHHTLGNRSGAVLVP